MSKSRRSSSMKSIVSYVPHTIGPYLLDQEIGNGASSVVYRAFLKESNDQILLNKSKCLGEDGLNEDYSSNENNNKKLGKNIKDENYTFFTHKNEEFQLKPFSKSNSFCSLKENSITRNFLQSCSKVKFREVQENFSSNYSNDQEGSVSDQQVKYFAIKIFPKTNLESQKDEELFQREINAMAFFKHKNIISLIDVLSDDYNFYLVMDYCQGFDLKTYISKYAPEGINEKTSVKIFKQIVSAISYCHSLGVAHRDIKPENVLITTFPKIKLSDFGLCGYINENQLMRTFCGSPCYCAPECLNKIEYDGRRADTWSLGVLLYTMVVGSPPWSTSNSSIMIKNIIMGKYSIPKHVSQSCKSLITGMMNINPRERLTMEQIIDHPWLNQSSEEEEIGNSLSMLVDDNNYLSDENSDNFIDLVKSSSGISSSKSMKLAEFSKVSFMHNQITDHGIYCPFSCVVDKSINSGSCTSNDDDDENDKKQENENDKNENKHFNSQNFGIKAENSEPQSDPTKKKKEASLRTKLSNSLDSGRTRCIKQTFPVIKKQRKKPRRSDLSLCIAVLNPSSESFDNMNDESKEEDIEETDDSFEIKPKEKSELKEKRPIKHPSSIPVSRRHTDLNAKMNSNIRRHHVVKLSKFPKKSKSHLNLITKSDE